MTMKNTKRSSMMSLTVAATAISSSVSVCSGLIPAFKAVVTRRNKGALCMFVDPRAPEIGAAVRSSVDLGYAPVSAAEYAMMDTLEQQRRQQPVVVVREHPTPEDMNMFAYPTEEAPQPQQQPQSVMNNGSTKRYFKDDHRRYNEVLPGVFAQHEEATDLTFPLSETIPSTQPQYDYQTREEMQGIPNRDMAEALHSASSMAQPQPKYQQQYQQPQPQYQQQYQVDTLLDLGLVTELEYSYRWGEVLPDAEKDDLALFILPNTLYCPKSLSIYYDRVLLFGGWEEILPDDLADSSQDIRSRESRPFWGYDIEKRRKTTPTTDEKEPSIVEVGPGAFL